MEKEGKRCRVCGEWFSLDEFPRHPYMADGHLHRCMACDRQYKREWYQANRERLKAKSRAHHEAKKDEINARYRQRWRDEPGYRGRKIALARARYHKNPEAAREAARRLYHRIKERWHPQKFAEMQRRARARAKGLETLDLTLDEWLGLLAKHDNRCVYCGSNRDITMDHQLPIQRGGRHDKENVVPACRKCNASKRDMTVAEWIAEGGFGRRKRGR